MFSLILKIHNGLRYIFFSFESQMVCLFIVFKNCFFQLFQFSKDEIEKTRLAVNYQKVLLKVAFKRSFSETTLQKAKHTLNHLLTYSRSLSIHEPHIFFFFVCFYPNFWGEVVETSFSYNFIHKYKVIGKYI